MLIIEFAMIRHVNLVYNFTGTYINCHAYIPKEFKKKCVWVIKLDK